MSPFQSNETELDQPAAVHMVDTTDEFRIQCLLISLAMYFLLTAFVLGAMNGSLNFISIAESIDLCRPSSTIAMIISTARRMLDTLVTYRDRQQPELVVAPPAELYTDGLLALSDDALGVIFEGLRNPLEPRVALALGGACRGLWASTKVQQQQLRADHEAATALCLKVGMRSCKELREAEAVISDFKCLSAADLATLGTLGSVLPALERLVLYRPTGSHDGVQRLAEGLGAGALPAVTCLQLLNMHVGDAGASALAAALDRGALPRLKWLGLANTAIGDAGLVALVPALRRLPALECIGLCGNPFGDEGLTALVAPPPPAGAPPPPTGELTNLKALDLTRTQITDAGYAVLADALVATALVGGADVESIYVTLRGHICLLGPPMVRRQDRLRGTVDDLGAWRDGTHAARA